MSYMREAVERGMEFLDREHPRWELKIDLGKLDLSDTCTCVLGQLEGDYFDACEAYGKDEDWAVSRGFDIPDSSDWYDFADPDNDYDELTDAWRTALKERLDAGITV